MIVWANTTISVLRGSETQDRFGDAADADTPNATGIPASIMPITKMVLTADSNTPMIVRYYVGRVGIENDVQEGDRIMDERTNILYAIDSLAVPENPIVQQDIHMDLKRVGSI